MSFFDSKHQRAAWMVALLGLLIAIALAPYASGILGAPVLYIILAPLHTWMVPKVRSRTLASSLMIVVGLVGIVLPFSWMVSLLVGQAQGAANAIVNSPILDRLDTLTIGPYAIGQEIRELGSRLVGLMGGGAISLLGRVTRIVLNLVFAFTGLFFILQDPEATWRAVRPFIPFSDDNVRVLRERFAAVTKSTVLGTGLSAVAQGVLLAIAFSVLGLGNAVFWGAVTVVFSILPVLGSGLIWLPGAIVLFTNDRIGAAVALLVIGAVIIANVDNVIRPWVSNRYAQIHPMITLVGAIAGVSYLGILGLLIGPLALSYFFELMRMYRREYLAAGEETAEG